MSGKWGFNGSLAQLCKSKAQKKKKKNKRLTDQVFHSDLSPRRAILISNMSMSFSGELKDHQLHFQTQLCKF